MTEEQSGQGAPTSKQLRDARRQAHEAQKASQSGKGGRKTGMKGKGARKP